MWPERGRRKYPFLRTQNPTEDAWAVKEKLYLLDAVQLVGENDWTQVSKLMQGDDTRKGTEGFDKECFTPQSCYRQYQGIMETVGKDIRKRGEDNKDLFGAIRQYFVDERLKELSTLEDVYRTQCVHLYRSLRQREEGGEQKRFRRNFHIVLDQIKSRSKVEAMDPPEENDSEQKRFRKNFHIVLEQIKSRAIIECVPAESKVKTVDIPEENDSMDVTVENNSTITTDHTEQTDDLFGGLREDESEQKRFRKNINIVLEQIKSHKNSGIFLKPILDSSYLKSVKRPMDLSTLKKNLESGEIRNVVAFEKNVLLMFVNAIMYNNETTEIYKMAKAMETDVRIMLKNYKMTHKLLNCDSYQDSWIDSSA